MSGHCFCGAHSPSVLVIPADHTWAGPLRRLGWYETYIFQYSSQGYWIRSLMGTVVPVILSYAAGLWSQGGHRGSMGSSIRGRLRRASNFNLLGGSKGMLERNWDSLPSVSLFISGANEPSEGAALRIRCNLFSHYPAHCLAHKWQLLTFTLIVMN